MNEWQQWNDEEDDCVQNKNMTQLTSNYITVSGWLGGEMKV